MFDGSLRALPISANLIMNPNIPQGFGNGIAEVKKASTQALGPLHQSEASGLPSISLPVPSQQMTTFFAICCSVALHPER